MGDAMKILFAEEADGRQQPEQAFDLPVISVGRDPQCQIVFDQDKWPMVSRRHAELRLQDGRYVLVDIQSSYGTYIDGRCVTEPTEVRVGEKVQFGVGGPVLRIVWIEPDQSLPESSQIPDRGKEEAGKPLTSRQPPAFVELAEGVSGNSKRIEIKEQVLRIGRDPEMDLVIDTDVAVVSRRHAEIQRRDDQFVLVDLGSFNGTLLNDQRIATETPLDDGDCIQLGLGGPVLRFFDPTHPAPAGARQPGRRATLNADAPVNAAVLPPPSLLLEPLADAPEIRTIRADPVSGSPLQNYTHSGKAQPTPLIHLLFHDKSALAIGRAKDNDIRLDGLQISNHHARIFTTGDRVFIEDLGSTNGVYVGSTRITREQVISSDDVVQIGPFLLKADVKGGVAIYDIRSKTRIDAVAVTKIVPNRADGREIKLLDEVDLTIQPNEFVGLLGPSGAGKSTLMDALNGMRPATSGQVLVNNLDLYQHLDSLKQSIGYVPQDDIIHRELTVYRTLYYVARLRLSRDVSEQDIEQRVEDVMDMTGLSERRDVPVGQLSGGQRKRVSIAVELITQPSIIFLDEPTSGLDPATEEKIMELFRRIAESGRTVILTTHAMENVRLFDKIVVLMRGKLVFYGAPREALAHVKAESFKDLYDKLEAPITERLSKLKPPPTDAPPEQHKAHKTQKEMIAEEVAEEWKQRFQRTEQYERNVREPLSGLKREAQTMAPVHRRPTVTDTMRQWRTLSQRYKEVLSSDKLNLLILFGQAPIIALLTFLVVGQDSPRDFPFFMLALVAIWFGTSVAAREIVRERAVYKRERMVNLGLLPYVGSKLWVLSLIVSLQCLLLFGTLKLFHVARIMELPGALYGLPQLLVMILTGMVGIALGLFVSAVVKTSEMATSLVPLILIPQILFSGLVGVPQDLSKVVGVMMPATWSFDEMKRLSGLDILRGREEGAEPSSKNEGRGLYKEIKHRNDLTIDQKQQQVEDYKAKSESKLKDYQQQMEKYQKDIEKWRMAGSAGPAPKKPEVTLDPVPPKAEVAPIPDDLSDYVDFLHPWGHIWINPLVLLVMFFGLVAATILALRGQGIG